MKLRDRRAQSTLEYAIIFTAVVGALLAIAIYMQRGMQGRIKDSTDSVGKQFDPKTFTNSWNTISDGTTTSNENRIAGGQTTTNISASETVTRSEYGDWGTVPAQHGY